VEKSHIAKLSLMLKTLDEILKLRDSVVQTVIEGGPGEQKMLIGLR